MKHNRFTTWLALAAALAAQIALGQEASPRPPAQSLLDAPLWDIVLKGGYCLWLILLAAGVGLAFAVERALGLRAARHAPKDFDKDILHLVDTRGVDAGLAACQENRSSLSRVLHAALLRHGAMRQELEAAVAGECVRVAYDLRRNTRAIGVAAMLTPLLGLLGTCLGLIEAFDRAALAGTPDRLAAGVAAALLSAAGGLLAAVPLAFLYFHLRGKAGDIVREIEERGVDMVVALDRKARQSIRLIEDIDEHVDTQDMPGVRVPAVDLAGEFDDPHGSKSGSKVKSSLATPAQLPAVGRGPAQPVGGSGQSPGGPQSAGTDSAAEKKG